MALSFSGAGQRGGGACQHRGGRADGASQESASAEDVVVYACFAVRIVRIDRFTWHVRVIGADRRFLHWPGGWV